MDTLVSIKNLKKCYERKKAVDGITIDMDKGKIIGLLGPNGSGKSTILKLMAGLIKPTSGYVLIDNTEPGIETKKIVSFMPETDSLYGWMTVRYLIDFIASFYDDWNQDKETALIKFFDLDGSAPIRTLSKGQRSKVKLLTVLARDARLLLLDEPLSGIDYMARDMILEAIVHNYREKEQTMIISTHEVPMTEGIFDDVIFLDNGVIIKNGYADRLRDEYGMSIAEMMKEVYRQ